MSRIENISMQLNDWNCIPNINRIKIIDEIALLNLISQKYETSSTYKHMD